MSGSRLKTSKPQNIEHRPQLEIQNNILTMATPLPSIECSAQPLSISFHPTKDIVAAGLVDGTIELHDLIACPLPKCSKDSTITINKNNKNDEEEDDDDDNMEGDDSGDEADTILASIRVAKDVPTSKTNTQMLAKLDDKDSSTSTKSSNGASKMMIGKATQGPSCRCVLFSRSPLKTDEYLFKGGDYIYTACNNGSLRCLDSELACNSLSQIHHNTNNNTQSPIVWSIENAHNAGINKIYQLPHSSPCGPALVTGDDIGTVRIWDTRICGSKNSNNNQNLNNNNGKSNPFDNLMKLPRGCIQHWKVNHDYITDFETNNDGTTLFASSADGTLSIFDLRYINRKGTSRSVAVPDIDPHKPMVMDNNKKCTWETSGYTQSDNQEDELLSLVSLKNSKKLLCGTQQGTLSLFSYNMWGDISDRFPGHPHSIDAILKIDEDTVLTGSSDGLVRAVQLLPNALLGVLGQNDGFPVEDLGWSAGRKMVGSVSHDEYIRLWDASILSEDYESDENEEQEKEGSKKQSEGVSTKAGNNNSDDDWEDMDEDKDDDNDDDMNSDDDDSSDSDDGGAGGKSNKREQIFKSDNEKFFSDL